MVAVRLIDPAETRFPDVGLLSCQDAESGEQIFVDTHDAGFHRRFRHAARQQQAAHRAAFSRAGVDCIELSTEDDLLDALVQFTQMREARSRNRLASQSGSGERQDSDPDFAERP